MPPARRKTTKTTTEAVTDQDFQPLVLRTLTEEERGPEERVVLFTLDGVDYTIPKRFPVRLGLKIIRTMRRSGHDIAAAELLEEAIGTEAYDALVSYPDLKQEHIARLFEIVQALALGAVEDPKGN